MKTQSDSNDTYCSEVEKMLAITTELSLPNKHQPLRRSQRISQGHSHITWDDVFISSTGKIIRKSARRKRKAKEDYSKYRTMQKVFSAAGVMKDQESHDKLTFCQMTTESNNVLVTTVKKLTVEKLGEDVPLDLTVCKSDVFLSETSLTQAPQYNANIGGTGLIASNLNVYRSLNSARNTKEILVVEDTERNAISQSTVPFRNCEVKTIAVKDNIYIPNENFNMPSISREMFNIGTFYGTDAKVLQASNAPTEDALGENLDITEKKSTSRNSSKRRGRPCKKRPLSAKGSNKKFKRRITKKYSNNMDLIKNCEALDTKGESKIPARTHQISHKTMLPDIYPPHFKYQLPPEAVSTQPLIATQSNFMTPDLTQSLEWGESSSTSPSLPESLRGLFERNSLKQILDIENVTTYRLQDYHIHALATILSLRVEYLYKILDKILAIEPTVLCKTTKAIKTPFAKDRDLFAKVTSSDSGSPSDTVLNSQSPEIPRLFPPQSESKRNLNRNT